MIPISLSYILTTNFVPQDTSSDEVTLSFEDGTFVTANLLVACDGIHSQTRAQFITDKPRYSGRIAYRGLLPLSAVESFWPFSSYAISWLAPNKHFLVFPISQNKTINVVAFVSKPLDALDDLKESWTSSAPREDLAREFEGWDPVLGKLIDCMEPFPGKWRLNDRELLSQWSFMDGKVVLLGDAAHAMLPHQGTLFSELFIYSARN
jgi:salicylate hydroxylase